MNVFRRLLHAGVLLALPLALVAGCGKSNPVAPTSSAPPLDSLSIAPDDTLLKVGETVTFVATAIDTLGAPVAATLLDWTSTDTGVFTVNRSGVVSARGEGSAWLIVSGGGLADTAQVTVVSTRTGWFVQVAGGGNALNGVFVLGDGRSVWAVGDGGRILATRDAGATWAAQASRTVFTLNGVWFTSASEGWVVGNGGTLLHTTNAGALWTLVPAGSSDNLMDVCFATPDTGWVVGGNGTILRTFDGGTTWSRSNPVASTLHGVSFAGTRLGWAVGDNGIILGTTDRGLNWTQVSPSVTAQSLKAVWRRGTLVANAAGTQGVTPRTVDGGGGQPQWTLVNAGASYALEGVCFPSDLVGYAVGYNGSGVVLRTSDGGQSWSPQVSNTTFRLNDVHFLDDLRGWAVGANGTILHTVTGGE